MKRIILTALFSFMVLTSCSNQYHVNQFYNKYQGTENTMSFKAPLFLASLMMNDSELQLFRDKIKSVKFLTINDLNDNRNQLIQKDIQSALQKDGFENWFNLNQDGNIINVSVQNRGDALRNLVIAMQGEDNLIFVNAKTNLTESELTKFITKVADFMKNDDKNDKNKKQD